MLMKLHQLFVICFILCIVLILSMMVPTPVLADPDPEFLELILNEGVSTPWAISNVMPGANGVETVELRNAGNIDGYLAVWIGNIIDIEGANCEAETGDTGEPGELGQYLTLNISGENIVPYVVYTYIKLPIPLNTFSHSSDYPLYLGDQPLEPGEKIELQWKWEIPPSTTNTIQGDQVTFDINYMLLEYIPPEYKPPLITGGISGVDYDDSAETEDSTHFISETDGPETTITRTYHSPDGKLTLIVPENTNVISVVNEEISDIIITTLDTAPALPGNISLLSPVYDITVFTPTRFYKYTRLDRPATIEIDLSDIELPEQFLSICVARYEPGLGWIKLAEISETDLAAGKITLQTRDLSAIAILAELASEDDSATITVPPPSDGTILDASRSQFKIDLTNIASGSMTGFEIPRQISLIIAVSGTIAMIVLASIERKRRNRKNTAKF